jgi:hypothetical protein
MEFPCSSSARIAQKCLSGVNFSLHFPLIFYVYLDLYISGDDDAKFIGSNGWVEFFFFLYFLLLWRESKRHRKKSANTCSFPPCFPLEMMMKPRREEDEAENTFFFKLLSYGVRHYGWKMKTTWKRIWIHLLVVWESLMQSFFREFQWKFSYFFFSTLFCTMAAAYKSILSNAFFMFTSQTEIHTFLST